MLKDGRSQYRWPNKNAYLLSILQNVIGLGNITLHFFAFTKYGGVVDLIPLCVCTLVVGIPAMYMELLIGQAFRKGSLEVWNELCPFLKGIGYCYILQALFVQVYYVALLGHVLDWFLSVWCYPNIYNKINTSISAEIIIPISKDEDFIGFNQEYLPSFILALGICYICIQRGALSISRVSSFFFIYSNIALFVLVVKGISSPLSFVGIEYTFKVDWKQLWNPMSWLNAINIVTFSGSLGTGLLINFSSYVGNYSINLKSFSAVVLIFDMIFGILSALQISTSFKTIIFDKPEYLTLNIIQYMPVFYQSMNYGWVFAFIYNLHVFILSLTTVFTNIEQIHIALTYRFWLFKHYTGLTRIFLIIVNGCLSSICLTKYGRLLMNYFINYGGKYTTFLLIAMESVAICYSYGFDKFYYKVDLDERERPGKLMHFAWAVLIPIIYIVTFVASFATFTANDYRIVMLELGITSILISPIPLNMIYYHTYNWIMDKRRKLKTDPLKFK
ncbi:hypothetical protein GJ496_003487 [Pomphorhynchus laevis]|nr:hypothetical protein GJ496_003487 [Pomphorhynchus laevis]